MFCTSENVIKSAEKQFSLGRPHPAIQHIKSSPICTPLTKYELPYVYIRYVNFLSKTHTRATINCYLITAETPCFHLYWNSGKFFNRYINQCFCHTTNYHNHVDNKQYNNYYYYYYTHRYLHILFYVIIWRQYV